MRGDAPPRPDTSAWMRRRGPGRRWLPAIGVLTVLSVTTLGGFVAAGALSEPVGAPVDIPGVVSVQPLSGWEPADPGTSAGRPFVRLTRGSGTLAAVAWGPFPADAAALAVEVRDRLLDDLLGQLTVSETLTPVVLDQGLEAQRFTFVGIDRESGVAVEGEVTTTVSSDGQGVVFVGLAHEGLLAFIAGDLHTMIGAAVVGQDA